MNKIQQDIAKLEQRLEQSMPKSTQQVIVNKMITLINDRLDICIEYNENKEPSQGVNYNYSMKSAKVVLAESNEKGIYNLYSNLKNIDRSYTLPFECENIFKIPMNSLNNFFGNGQLNAPGYAEDMNLMAGISAIFNNPNSSDDTAL